MRKLIIILFMFLIGTLGNVYALNDSLVYYSFDEDTTADETEIFGIEGVEGILNGGFEFDGVNDYIETSLEFSGDSSTSFWVYIDLSVSNSNSNFVRNLISKSSSFTNSITYSENSKELRVYDSSTEILSHTFVSSGWYYITITFESNSNLYVNGVLEDTGDNFNFFDNSNNLKIGGGTSNRYFEGSLDEVAIYDRVLTSTEISELYNSGNGETAPNVADDYIYYLPMDSLTDLSGNNYNAESYEGVKISDNSILETSFDFEGGNEYLRIANPYDIKSGDFSVSFWINYDDFNNAGIIANNPSNPTQRKVIIYNNNERLRFQTKGSGSTSNFDSTTLLNKNQWYHIVVTRTGSSGEIYINGNLDKIGTTATGDLSSNSDWIIGNYDVVGTTGPFFDGNLDEFAVYDRVLTSTEISELYNNGDGFNPYEQEPTGLLSTNIQDFYNSVNISIQVNNTVTEELKFSLNGGSNTSLGVTNSTIFNLTGLSEGVNTIDFYFGSSTEQYNFTIDITNPSINLINTSERNNYFIEWADVFTFSDTNLDSCVVYVENIYTNCSSYTFNFNGNRSVLINVTDLAGNTNITEYTQFINPRLFLNFEFNNTNVVDYQFGSKTDNNGLINFTIYNDFVELGNNTFTFDKFGFVLQNFSLIITNTTNTNFTFDVIPAQINVNIFDRETNNLITNQVEIQLIGNVGDNIVTTNGTAVLRAVDGIPGDYQVIALSSGYETESVFFSYNNQEFLELDIYLINSTVPSIGVVTVEVKDTLSFFVDAAIVNLLEWKPSQNSFISVAQCETFSDGKCLLNVELGNKLYKFQAIKGSASKTTSSLIIEESGKLIPITLESIVLDQKANSDNIIAEMTQDINNVTNISIIRLEWSTRDNTNAKACLNVFESPGYAQKLLNKNCSVSNSGVIFMTTNISRPSTIQVIGTVQDSKNVLTIDIFTYKGTGSLANALEQYNLNVLVPIILLLLGFSVGLFFGNIYISLILAIVGQWVGVAIVPSVINSSMAVVISILCLLVMWGIYKR